MSQEIAEKIRAAAQARGLDPELAVSIARAESSLNPSAKAARSSASGLFQVTTDTWKQYKGAPGKQFDPDENIRVGMDIIADNMGSLRTALGREPRPAEVYAAHYFGPAGARSVLAAQPDTPIGDILSKRAIAANPNLKGKTVGAVLAQLEGKVGSSAVAAAPVAVQPDVSKPAVAPAAAAGEPGGRVVSRETGQEPAARLASLGPGYQAALALSFLADEDEKEERDLDRDPSISQQWLAQQASRPTGLALSDISIRSPFAAQEPVRMNEGGEVESKASRLLKQLVPMDVRVFGSTLLGNREPLTEKSFTEQELAAMQQAVDTAVKRTGQAQKGSVQYEDYPKGEAIGPGYQPVGQTLGRFTYEKTPEGRTVITDRYDFYNEGRKGNVERYEKMGRGERAASVSANMLKNLLSGDFRGVPGELADAYIGRQGRDVRINLPPVKRAEGSPEEGERLTPQQIERIAQLEAKKREEAEKPAFLTPKSGIGRKISTKPGELELAAVQGMSELPYLLAGAPVDLATMAMRPFGYDVERPMLGSEDLKERALRAGIRQEPPKGEAARALYSMAELGASAVNPAAPVRGAVAAAQKTGEAAKMLARDFQQYNRQLDVPGASYAIKPRGGHFTMEGQTYGSPQDFSKPVDSVTNYVNTYLASTNDPVLNEWMRAKVGAYIRRDMGTEMDQFVRAADEGKKLHFINKPITEGYSGPHMPIALRQARKTEGFPEEGVAKTPYGQDVEMLTDRAVNPVRLEDVYPSSVPPGLRQFVETDPSMRIYELDAWPLEEMKFQTLRNKMEQMRQLPESLSFYSQPGVKVPERYKLTDQTLQGLTPAQASERVAQFDAWKQDARQRMATKYAKEDPSLDRVELSNGVTAVQLPDLQSSPRIKQLALDIGCDGNWCTRQETSALVYGSGDSRLHILVDKKARPVAQITFTKLSPTKKQLEADPSASDRFSITEMLGKDNSSDFSQSPALPAIQQYIKFLDRRYGLSLVANLDKVDMKQMDNLALIKGAQELSKRRQRYTPNMSSEEYKAAWQRDLIDFETAIYDINGGSKYLTKDQDMNSLVQQTLDQLAPQQRATGGMIDRQSTDNRKYL